jgi:hypothetical protein
MILGHRSLMEGPPPKGTRGIAHHMIRRYQVFVSSTYEDLNQERQAALQVLLDLNCIPSGMELFPAADESSWTLIKKMIDACDYYVLIIGGRYGSVGKTGKSYTQMEYEYARKRKPVLAFIHADPGTIPSNKTERNPKRARALSKFLVEVQKQQCRKWYTAEDLRVAVTQGIVQLIGQKPAQGWIRAPKEATDSTGRRGVTLLEAIRTAGLVDIELRDSSEKTLPPEEFLNSAKHEVVITGPTLYTILKASHETTHVFSDLLGRGVLVKLLMLHPIRAATDIKLLGKRVGKPYLKSEIEQAIAFVIRQGLNKHPNFELRFAPSLATFNAIMIDGNIEASGAMGSRHAEIRVQPLNTMQTTHKGIVFQFRKTVVHKIGGYENFAEDLALQWKRAKPDRSFVRLMKPRKARV